MSRADDAKANFLAGYTCSQSVLLAFSDVTGLDADTAMKLSLPFGGGMGRLRLTCGAVSGAVMVLGLLLSESYPNPLNKKAVYAAVQEYCARYKETNGSYICGELLSGAHIRPDFSPSAEARTEDYYKKRPCPQLIHSAAEILEEYLRSLNRLS